VPPGREHVLDGSIEAPGDGATAVPAPRADDDPHGGATEPKDVTGEASVRSEDPVIVHERTVRRSQILDLEP